MALTPGSQFGLLSSGTISESNNLSVTYAAHDNVIVWVGWSNVSAAATQVLSVSDSGGVNQYDKIITDFGGSNLTYAAFYCKDAQAGTRNIKAYLDGNCGASGISVSVTTFTGLSNSVSVQAATPYKGYANCASGSQSVVVGPLTPTSAPAVLIGFSLCGTSNTQTVGDNTTDAFTLIAPNLYGGGHVFYREVSDTSAVSMKLTPGSTGWFNKLAAVFTPSGGATTNALIGNFLF